MARAKPRSDNPEEYKMTLGEHLDELRGCLVRSLAALVAACVLCAWPAQFLLEWTVQPLKLALREHGQPETLLATSPTESLLVYLKVVIFLGLTIASPYVIHQIWSFVGKGLYAREKTWVYKLAPASAGLFVVGVAFMYVFVLYLSLSFLIGFGTWLPSPPAQATWIQALLGAQPRPPATQPAPGPAPSSIPVVFEDPREPKPGDVWLNATEMKLKAQAADRTVSVHVQDDSRQSLVTTHFRIGDYLTFVMVLALGFGLAFQIPLVVIFLVRSGIAPRATLARSRKFVVLIIVIIAGALAPPDLVSHLLLAGPMILLFELGLWLTRDAAKEARPA